MTVSNALVRSPGSNARMGLVSDLIALMLLALPLNIGRGFEPQPAAAGRWRNGEYESIDGDYRRIE